MTFLLATADALATTRERVRMNGCRIRVDERARAARTLAFAVHHGLASEGEVDEALRSGDDDASLVRLGCRVKRRYSRRALPTRPAFAASPRLSGYTDDVPRATREAIRLWLGALCAARIVTSSELHAAAQTGTRTLVTLALDGWDRVRSAVQASIEHTVGPVKAELGLWMAPSFVHALQADVSMYAPDESASASAVSGIFIEMTDPPLVRVRLSRHRDDKDLPLLMAAIEILRRRVVTFELATPTSMAEGEMDWSVMETVAPFAGDAVLANGDVVIPNALAEQLEGEFGFDIADPDVSRSIKDRLLVGAGRSPIAPIQGNPAELRRRLRESGRSDGPLAPALATIDRALCVLESHRRKAASLHYEASDESSNPIFGLFTDLISFDAESLVDNANNWANSGMRFAHELVMRNPVDLARLAWTEVCAISAVITELDRLA